MSLFSYVLCKIIAEIIAVRMNNVRMDIYIIRVFGLAVKHTMQKIHYNTYVFKDMLSSSTVLQMSGNGKLRLQRYKLYI